MQKSWMWYNEKSTGTEGVIIDFEENRVQWFDEPGCACSGSTMDQTIEDFRDNGARFIVPPDDILEEMRTAIEQVPST